MATCEPQIDPFDPALQQIRDEFERRYLGKQGFEGIEADAGREYNRAAKRPYICALMADVLSGRWGLGRSQEEVAARLGTQDRSWLSVALRHGDMTTDLLLRLRCCGTRPDDWEPDIGRLSSEMRRSGFMGGARYLATYVTDRASLVDRNLTELDYELLCEQFAQLPEWRKAQQAEDVWCARHVVTTVCRDPERNVIPNWQVKRERLATERRIAELGRGEGRALSYLRELEANWFDVFVATACVVETVGWK